MDKMDRHDGRDVAEECALVAARLMESVSKTSQMASWANPEMQEMFSEWLDIIGRQTILGQDLPGSMDVASRAGEIGISTTTLLGLLLYLHRNGSIVITNVELDKGSGCNEDICCCLKGK